VVQVLEKEHAEKIASAKSFPDFAPGDVLELKLVMAWLVYCN
jgi:ribosomal protein L19